VADPATPAAAPADAAAPAAADNGSAQAPADSATPVAAPAMPALTQPGPIYSQPKS